MNPIVLVATHPRSTSTALERSFMSRPDIFTLHEPFGDAFYFGPERLSDRYAEKELKNHPQRYTTYGDVLDRIVKKSKDATVVVKDMAYYLMPPTADCKVSKSSEDALQDPTVLPDHILNDLRVIFLIRAPNLSIPSYYRCCIPPQSEETGFDHYRNDEAGYKELRILYDYMTEVREKRGMSRPLVIDSLDLLNNPEEVLKSICEDAQIAFDPGMLSWKESDKVNQVFSKWNGFHDSVLKSNGFAKRETKQGYEVDLEQWESQWKKDFDEKGVKIIKESVLDNLDDYLYLRQFKWNSGGD
jgi:hypothetical protein